MSKDFLQQAYEELNKLKQEHELLTHKIKVLEGFISAYVPNSYYDVTSDMSLPLPYPSNSTISNKIIYFLNLTKRGQTSEEIFEYIANQDNIINETERQTLYESVRQIASNLRREEKIKAIKQGNKNIYSL